MTHSQISLTIAGLRCEHVVDPLGVQRAEPLLAWELRSRQRGARPLAFRILAASSLKDLNADHGDLWDSGKVLCAQQQALAEIRKPVSRQRVHWKAMAWDENDRPSAWSKPAYFEYGILHAAEWAGEWIGAGETEAAPCLRREFNVGAGLTKARAYFSGLGYGELYLNGSRVGDAKLSPGWTDYDAREYRDLYYPYQDKARKRVLYLAWDVTALVAPGRNAVGCILGNGMHNQRTRINEGRMAYGPPRMLLNLVLEYADGRREVVCSDPTWKWAKGPIRLNQMFLGERYDARLELPEAWTRRDFDDAPWQTVIPAPRPAGELHAQLYPPDRVIASLPPVAQNEPGAGIFVLDFGRVISGWLKIRVCGRAGQKVMLRFSEELNVDGTLDFRSAGATSRTVTGEPQIQTDEYILSGCGVETYEPRFVWHAFRYAEISGWPDGAPENGAIIAQIVHMDVPPTGEFASSNPLFAQINEAFRATQLANWHSGVISDCPHRERLGYTGDGQIACEAALWNFQAASAYAKWIDDLFDAQNQESGFVPHTAPFYGGGGGYGWGAACIIMPWMFAKFYGDPRVLSDHFQRMTLWMDYIERHCDERGIVTSEEPESWCLGDWSFPIAPSDHTGGPVPRELVNTFYFGHCARLMAEIAGLLGRTEEARAYGAKLEKIRTDFHRAFYDVERGCYAEGRGGANAFALALGAVPAQEAARVQASLLEHSKAFDTGIFGTPILLDALMEHGGAAQAYALMAGREFPSLGYMLASGATTLWESWSKEVGSHCHPMFGSVCAWFYRRVVGLEQAANSFGFEELLWRPWATDEITSARMTFHSPKGMIALDWQRDAQGLTARAELPPGTKMKIEFPHSLQPGYEKLLLDGAEVNSARLPTGILRFQSEKGIEVEIGSGTYEFRCV